MELSTIFDVIINNFDFGLILSINVLVYTIIKIISVVSKETISKLIKIIITILVSVCFGFLYWKVTDNSASIVLNSCICATLIWDWFLKPILGKLKIDYNGTNNYEEKN